MADIKLQEIHDLLIEIALEAGRMMMAATPSYLNSEIKKNTTDLVTETDQAIEKMVSTRLTSAYPTFSFMGEETYKPGMKLTSAPTFICDPIDGTMNFVHSYPMFCISLGFVVDKVPTVGIIYSPFFGELFTAIKGQGAFVTRNGEKLKLPYEKEPKPFKDLSTCMVTAEWGNERSGNNFDIKADVFRKLAAAKEDGGSMVHALKSCGSSAMNLSYVATGQLDIWWEGGPWAWDVAAGWCILVEAGGMMVSGNPGDWKAEIDGRNYLAVRGAPSGQKEIVEEFWKVIGDRKMVYEG